MALTLRQENFATHYVAYRHPESAYRHSFDVGPDTLQASVRQMASEQMGNLAVASRIAELEAQRDLALSYDVADTQRLWLDIATADPNELISLKVGCCRYCRGFEHGFQWREREYVEAVTAIEWENRRVSKKLAQALPDFAGGFGFNATLAPIADCPECHGEGIERVVARDTTKLSPGGRLLYGGVKKTKNGLEIIIADRTKALENFTRMQGGFVDKSRIDVSVTLAAASVQLQTTDPVEASRVYQDMIRGIAHK